MKQTEANKANDEDVARTLVVVAMPVGDLKPHPRNYRRHPEDQLEHIRHSIVEHGHYRNVVVARDGTILAGHGVVLATKSLGLPTVPAIRLDVEPDDPRAIRLLVGDNEIGHLGEIGDRQLSELLKSLQADDAGGLLGSGFDEMQLANLLLVTRPASEVKDLNEAADWAGVPEYDRAPEPRKVVVSFDDEAALADFCQRLGLKVTDKTKSLWWPPRADDDTSSIRFE